MLWFLIDLAKLPTQYMYLAVVSLSCVIIGIIVIVGIGI